MTSISGSLLPGLLIALALSSCTEQELRQNNDPDRYTLVEDVDAVFGAVLWVKENSRTAPKAQQPLVTPGHASS